MRYCGDHLNNCPPKAAKPEEVTYFRLIMDGVVTREDFLSHTELYPENEQYARSCNTHALSLVPNLEAAMRLVKKFPKRFEGHGLAKIEIKTAHGKLLRDKPEHASLWRAEAATPESLAAIAQLEIPNASYQTVAQMLEGDR